MRRLGMFFAAGALLLVVAPPAMANSDPHRFPFGWGSFDRYDCGFAVHFDTWSREYGSVSADGSVMRLTGAAGATLSANGKTLELNLSGPATYTFLPDGGMVQVSQGRSILWGPNLEAFGLPSNMVATSGPSVSTSDPDGAIVSMPIVPHVMVDVCAALS